MRSLRTDLALEAREIYEEGNNASSIPGVKTDVKELEDCGLYNISLSGTTVNEVGYGERIYLNISGTYDNNVLRFASGISKVTKSPTTVTIQRQSTAKQ